MKTKKTNLKWNKTDSSRAASMGFILLPMPYGKTRMFQDYVLLAHPDGFFKSDYAAAHWVLTHAQFGYSEDTIKQVMADRSETTANVLTCRKAALLCMLGNALDNQIEIP